MSLLDRAVGLIRGRRAEPIGSIRVVDPSPLNWLYITYNTVEELVRVTPKGANEPAAMSNYRWVDDLTLEIDLRRENFIADGSLLTGDLVAKAFHEAFRWKSPHPPGTHFNLDQQTRIEVVNERQVRVHLPSPDGLALGKLRAIHLMSMPFWNGPGFGYSSHGSGEGHW